jgi:PIN domain nuclease of toxin-antitoxin system
MAKIDVKLEATSPLPPESGYLRLYPTSSGWKYKDSSNNEFTLSTGVTFEEVEDIVGNLIQSTSTINVTYDDVGNLLTLDVIQSAISHQNLDGAGVNTHAQIDSHISSTANPHSVTKTQIGLGNVDNTSDLNKPISTATQAALDLKQAADADLTAVAALAGAGFAVRTTTNTWATRSIVAGTGVGVTNSDGVFGSPTISNTDRGSVAVTTHEGLADPHPQYETSSELDVRDTNNRNRANHTGTQLSSTISDFSEGVQDVVGSLVADSSTIDATYNDGANSLTLAVIPSGIDHQNLSNVGTNTHTQIDSHIASTANPHSVTKAQVGLGNVDNTSDLNKPISTATQTALNLKYDASNPNGYETPAQLNTRDTNNRNRANHTGTQLAATISDFTESTQDVVGAFIVDSSTIDVTYNDVANTLSLAVLPAGVNHQNLNGAGTNTHAQIDSHIASTANPHAVTQAQVGLGNVDNTSDLNKPISTATQTALDLKYNASNPNGYETPAQLNTRDTNNRARANHTGTQLASTISDFAATVRGTILTGVNIALGGIISSADTILDAIGKAQAQISTLIARNINTGTGLTGGGNLSADRTISIANTAVTPGTYGNGFVPQFTVNAQGQLTAASNGPALVLGDNFNLFQDTVASTTTSNVYSNASSFTTPVLGIGQYRLFCEVEFNPHATTNDVLLRLLVDGVQVGREFRQEFSETATQQCIIDILAYTNFATAVTHTIDLQFRTETNASGTLTIRSVQVELWRV